MLAARLIGSRLPGPPALGRGVAVGSGVRVTPGSITVAVGVKVNVGVLDGGGVPVAVAVGVSVGVEVGVSVGVSVGVAVAVLVAVAVGVGVSVGVNVGVKVAPSTSAGDLAEPLCKVNPKIARMARTEILAHIRKTAVLRIDILLSPCQAPCSMNQPYDYYNECKAGL
jgi:hypothetical protein